MLPVAHGLVGATMVASLASDPRSRNSRHLLLGAVLGIAPDFDYAIHYVPGLGGGWHHGFTHSLIFGCLVGLLMSLCFGKGRMKSTIVYSVAIIFIRYSISFLPNRGASNCSGRSLRRDS